MTSPIPLSPLLLLISQSQLIKQGAEAKVYKTSLYPSPLASTSTLPPPPVLLKHRFKKSYRHPTLDTSLTLARLTAEARSLLRCAKAGVRVPGLRVVSKGEGVLGMEWVEGWSLREVLGGGGDDDEGVFMDVERDAEEEEEGEGEEEVGVMLRGMGVDQDVLLRNVGWELAKMHLAGIVHGDLTTSNMMVRLLAPSLTPTSPPSASFEIVLIDFGLSSVSSLPEDRAVDLYVLDRAFSSTHPVPLSPGEVASEELESTSVHFLTVLTGYREWMTRGGKKSIAECERVERRLEDVRSRGRKRSMVG